MKHLIAFGIGIGIVIMLSLVNAPRFVIMHLRVDAVTLLRENESAILILSAIALSAGLSFGGAYIAHALATTTVGVRWVALLIFWTALQISAVILLAPMLVAGIRTTDVAMVLTTSREQWVWAITAIVSGEVVSAGVMVAMAGLESGKEETASSGGFFDQLTKAATTRLISEIESPRQAPVTPATTPFTDYNEEPPQSVAQPAPIVVHEPPRVVARQADDTPKGGFATLQEVLTRQEPDEPRQSSPRQSTGERVAQLNAMSETTVEQVAQTFNIAPRSAQRLLAQSALTPKGNGVWARQHQFAAD